HQRWCMHCNVGYVAGHRIESARLFETMDPHGHDVQAASLLCENCHRAIESDGYCDICKVGFVDHKAYFTRLTYGLAQGTPVDAAQLSCPTCRANSNSTGWCAGCKRGMVGNVAFTNREVFDRTAREYRVLLGAIDRLPTCEVCACTMMVHRACTVCGISY